jgi:acetyl-CoA decarbonylase/synthase complex subunit beta
MAGQCSGGKQVEGFTGLSLEYMRSPKFLQADGGYERIIWLPKEIKESLSEYIPEDLKDKIPTEEDAANIKEMHSFLEEKGHPIMERLESASEAVKEAEEAPALEEEPVEYAEMSMEAMPMAPVAYAPELTMPASGGVKIIFKNAKVYAEKVIIKRK